MASQANRAGQKTLKLSALHVFCNIYVFSDTEDGRRYPQINVDIQKTVVNFGTARENLTSCEEAIQTLLRLHATSHGASVLKQPF